MNLLSLASAKGVPAADDFVPVMVFVLIKVPLTYDVHNIYAIRCPSNKASILLIWGPPR